MDEVNYRVWSLGASVIGFGLLELFAVGDVGALLGMACGGILAVIGDGARSK